MSPVFAHGQLRLYLLALLAEAPRHGYEIIRALEERFDGLYAPSAGTVYPRLAKLEQDGLVERHADGRKATYQITAAGRSEIAARGVALADLQQDLDHSARELADQVRSRVHGGARDLRAQLKQAAQEARRTASSVGAADHARIGDVEVALAALRRQVREAVRQAAPAPAVTQRIVLVLQHAATQIGELLEAE